MQRKGIFSLKKKSVTFKIWVKLKLKYGFSFFTLLNLLILMIILGGFGCTTVKIYNSSGEHDLKGVGILNLELSPGKGPLIVNTKGVGVVNGASHFTVGWMQENYISISNPDECHAIFIVNGSQEVQKIKKLLLKANITIDKICIASQQ